MLLAYVDRSLCLCARIHMRECGVCEYEWQACSWKCACVCAFVIYVYVRARACAEGAGDSVYLRLHGCRMSSCAGYWLIFILHQAKLLGHVAGENRNYCLKTLTPYGKQKYRHVYVKVNADIIIWNTAIIKYRYMSSIRDILFHTEI